MVWLPWKSKKKALETNEKSRERQDGAPATGSREAEPSGTKAATPGRVPCATHRRVLTTPGLVI
jgi:hypothetical protein